jgi:hypothetical protein
MRAKLAPLWRLLTILMLAKPVIPASAQSAVGVHRENSAAHKAALTASEVQALVPAPRPEDVASPRALVFALHASISGPAGPFDWSRFRSLFLPTASLGEAGTEPDANPHITFQSVNDWIRSVQHLRPKVAVHETVYKLRIEQFGSIASALYSHDSVTTADEGTTDIRRVNSCQMLYDGKRWWITSVVWNVSQKNWDLPDDLEP